MPPRARRRGAHRVVGPAPAAIGTAATAAPARRERIALVCCGDGWELRGANGHTLYRALGARARYACLVYAQSAGIVALAS